MIELVLDKHRSSLREGSVLIDATDPGQEPRVLFFLETNRYFKMPPNALFRKRFILWKLMKLGQLCRSQRVVSGLSPCHL
ncbi:MAG: hypothetical protein IPG51_19155 [Chloroflexi bacterium]|nr:hypothetical protein [Chloroflexota bacterium]